MHDGGCRKLSAYDNAYAVAPDLKDHYKTF